MTADPEPIVVVGVENMENGDCCPKFTDFPKLSIDPAPKLEGCCADVSFAVVFIVEVVDGPERVGTTTDCFLPKTGTRSFVVDGEGGRRFKNGPEVVVPVVGAVDIAATLVPLSNISPSSSTTPASEKAKSSSDVLRRELSLKESASGSKVGSVPLLLELRPGNGDDFKDAVFSIFDNVNGLRDPTDADPVKLVPNELNADDGWLGAWPNVVVGADELVLSSSWVVIMAESAAMELAVLVVPAEVLATLSLGTMRAFLVACTGVTSSAASAAEEAATWVAVYAGSDDTLL